MDKNIIKKSEMIEGSTYILCPDSNCEIFFTPKKDCIYDCPHPKKAKQLDYCRFCNDFYENDIKHSEWERKRHLCKLFDKKLTSSKVGNGKYILIHDYPK
jgi:hypothetical protein